MLHLGKLPCGPWLWSKPSDDSLAGNTISRRVLTVGAACMPASVITVECSVFPKPCVQRPQRRRIWSLQHAYVCFRTEIGKCQRRSRMIARLARLGSSASTSGPTEPYFGCTVVLDVISSARPGSRCTLGANACYWQSRPREDPELGCLTNSPTGLGSDDG